MTTHSPQKIKPIIPSWEDSDFAKTFEGQIMLSLKSSIIQKHFIESVLLSWATVEQVLLPRLIKFVSQQLKIELPSDIQRLNLQTTNLLYYCLSHDKDLFDKLEKGREYRNSIVHKIYKEKTIKDVEKKAKLATKYILENVQQQIVLRLEGKVLIPSINLYRDGWNDAVNEVCKILKI